MVWSSTNATYCSASGFNTGGATSGGAAVYPSQTTDYTVTCSGAGGTSSASATLYVNPPPPPPASPADLVPDPGLPLTTQPGQSLTLPVIIHNYGSGYAAAFPDKIQVCDAGCAGFYDEVNANSGALSSGQSAYTYASYTFNTPGTYYYQYCANYSPAWANVDYESNYANNCGGYGTITVGYPDLTASVGSVVATPPNTSTQFSGTASNVGNVPAGFFHNIIQTCDSGCATWNHVTAASDVGSLAAQAGQTIYGYDAFPSAGTYYYRFCANYNTGWANTVTESNYGNNCSNWQTVNVTSPDIVGYAGAVTAATINSPVGLSATLGNSGNGAAGAFPNILQVCDGYCAHINSIISATNVNSMAAGGSQTVSASYTPTSSTYLALSYRFCGNTNTSFGNVISESNYGNDCGTWQALNVSVPAPICSVFSANPPNVTQGGSTVLSWSCSNVTSCTGSGFSTGGVTSGSTTVTPPAGSSSYGLQCTGPYGNVNAPPVTVQAGCSGTPTGSITASPTRVHSGSQTTLTYGGTSVNSSCVLTKNGATIDSTSPTSCSVGPKQFADTVTSTSKYCSVCDGGTPVCTTVNVIPNFQEF